MEEVCVLLLFGVECVAIIEAIKLVQTSLADKTSRFEFVKLSLLLVGLFYLILGRI